ncbi:MAG: UDP-N-acetylmuramoyl-L-alanyl-D-glutamate--2,6-diaminopimelate ligase [Candidatus Omnitrophica bacterium]|nr:UDP-N-acetylmuramoyl-L-alanyl-D-glutamate--2,6-diaminopimelate ligase [Candidatus Omnitrophota bacterium]
MNLRHLINNVENQIVSLDNLPRNFLNTDIKGLSLNSKGVKKDYLFFCLPGTRYKGTDFINEAYLNGAKAVILQDAVKLKIPVAVIKVKDIIKSMGSITSEFYGYPSEKINMTAVTGTNGKTTITFAMENIWKAFGKKSGVIGTVNYRFGENKFSALNTTPDIITINNLLKRMSGNKVKFMMMEVSSHALAQRRIEGLKFNQAIFTNLTQDHLDYHLTKRNYFLAKSVLFTDYLKNNGTAVINIDDDYGIKLTSLIKKNKNRIVTYGIKRKADISAKDIYFDSCGSRFSVAGLKHKFSVKTNLIGIFNVYNALASIANSLVLGIPDKYIIKGLGNIYVPGRLEKVYCKQRDISIFVDYAHTEDGLKNVLLSLSKLKDKAKLIVVFGCGGDRDKDKRPKMGKVASELADFAIISSDNPRSEKPKDIISDIKKGMRKNNYIEIEDRKEAIKKAIDIAKEKDIILVAGKGHEDYQIIKDKRYPFNDRLVIEKILSGKVS